jgi:hypothetical protein
VLPLFRFLSASLVALTVFAPPSTWAQVRSKPDHFTGQQSCASSGCHGGGVGKDQFVTWQKKDVHSRANSILGNARSKQMGESLGIDDPSKHASCTICHSPMETVAPALLAPDLKPDKGVSCESCHGPAERYLRFHTRLDVTHDQRVKQGLREVQDLYGRANACVACHLNLDSEILAAGHPEMFFELDGQTQSQPPHWIDQGAWFGPKAWVTGQAAALRELSWKLSLGSKDSTLPARWEALIWLLRQTNEGAKQLPSGGKMEFTAIQTAADRLARIASRRDWTQESSMETLKRMVATSNEFRDELQAPDVLRRRAEVLVLGIDRLWVALKANGAKNDLMEKALPIAANEAKAQQGFTPARFAAALLQIEVALTK